MCITPTSYNTLQYSATVPKVLEHVRHQFALHDVTRPRRRRRRLNSCFLQPARVHNKNGKIDRLGPCTRPCLVVYALSIRPSTRADTVCGPCTWPCTRPCTDRAHGRVRATYTCKRPCKPLCACLRPCTGRVHILHGCVQAVYKMTDTASTRPRIRLCTRSCTLPCTRPAHGRRHIQYTAV